MDDTGCSGWRQCICHPARSEGSRVVPRMMRSTARVIPRFVRNDRTALPKNFPQVSLPGLMLPKQRGLLRKTVRTHP